MSATCFGPSCGHL